MTNRCIAKAYPESGIEVRTYHGILQPFTAHSHDSYVIGLVTHGRRQMICNGSSFLIAPEMLLVFNPGDVHECVQCDGGIFGYTSLVIEPDVFECATLKGPVLETIETIDAFNGMIEALEEGQLGNISDALQELKMTLLPNSDQPSDAPQTKRSYDIAERIQSALRTSISRPVTLNELASHEGISKYQVIRAYKNQYAITPFTHLSSFKVERACALLRSGVTPVQTAEMLDFADQSHLTRVFKQQIGMTPKAYQSMIQHHGPQATVALPR